MVVEVRSSDAFSRVEGGYKKKPMTMAASEKLRSFEAAEILSKRMGIIIFSLFDPVCKKKAKRLLKEGKSSTVPRWRMRGHKAWRSSLCAPGWHLKMLFFWLWQTDNESIQKCPPRYFSGGLDDRIAFASDPPLKNGWNFKMVKVPGYFPTLVSLLIFSLTTRLVRYQRYLRRRCGKSLCGRPATSCSASSPYGAAESQTSQSRAGI